MSHIQYHLRDLDVTERRVVSREELCQLHATGVRMKNRSWALSAIAVTSLALLFELGAHGWLPMELAKFGAIAVVLVTVFKLCKWLRPVWRMRRVSNQSEILDCEPADPFRSLDRHVRVVAPVGVVMQRDRSDLATPEALRIRSVAAIPPEVLADIERQMAEGAIDGSRVLEGTELLEARRRLGDKNDPDQFLVVVLVIHGGALLARKGISNESMKELMMLIAMVVAAYPLLKLLPPRRKPIEAKFSVRTSVDGTPVRWAEFIGEKVWTIEGKPADWRTR